MGIGMGSAGINMNPSSPLSMLSPLPPPNVPLSSSLKLTPTVPTPMATSTHSTLPSPSPVKTPAPPVKQPELINNNPFDDLLPNGGSRQQVQEFDNKKELKEFIKMFKKQNRKSYKSKNSNTRRNKKNDK